MIMMIPKLFGAAKAIKRVTGEKSSAGGTTGAFGRGILRFFQFVMALTVVGLYGVDVHAAHDAGVRHIDGRWLFAVTIGGLSALTTCIYALPFIKSYKLFAWDAIILMTWIVMVGLWGKIYVNADPAGDHRIVRMKHAVYVDAVNMLLWSISLGVSLIIWNRRRVAPARDNEAKV